MMVFLLHIHLFPLVWTTKVSEGNKTSLWLREKKSSFISMAIYILGGLLTLVLNQTRYNYGRQAVNPFYPIYSLWGDLRSYAGLIIDRFFLLQILFNIF